MSRTIDARPAEGARPHLNGAPYSSTNGSVNELQSLNPVATAAGPVLTIVIVNWNSGTMLRQCLGSIARTADGFKPTTDSPGAPALAGRLRVLVVDNNSSDSSADLVEREFPSVRLIRTGRNLGFGKGNNVARKHAAAGYVLFLNPDTELQPHALERMAAFLAEHPEVAAVGGKMIFPDGEVADQNLQWFPNPLTEFLKHTVLTYGIVRRLEGVLPWNDPLRSAYVQKLYGGCFMVRTVVLDKVGWFDERFFMYAEDVDLSRRIRETGWKLFYLSDAELMHVAGGTSRKAGSDFSTLMGCESMMQLIAKYQGTVSGFAYRASVFAASALRGLILGMLMLISPLLGSARRASVREAARNCWVRIQWALGMRRVFIPE
jgi:GT2 family glycosyltransferase